MGSGTTPTIREATRGDDDAIGDITVAAYATIDPNLGGYEAVIRDVAGRAKVATVLVAVEHGQIVGTVTYVGTPGPLSETPDPDAADIRMLAVAPDAMGRGIGRALTHRCIDLARRDRRRRLVLLTRDGMRAAQHLYESLGFRRAVDLDEPVGRGRMLYGYVLELAAPES